MPERFITKLGLPAGTTYKVALKAIESDGRPSLAGTFTAAVLALRRDPRVQGVELT
jgi:hypothetical protein